MKPTNPNESVYLPETAENLYDEIARAHQLLPDYLAAYKALNKTFQKCLNEQTAFYQVRLVGTFAKLDYLLKEHEAPPALWQAVNSTRVRFRKLMRDESDELQLDENWLYDLQSVCLFLEMLYSEPVPFSLSLLFPHARAYSKQTLVLDECVRMIVERWDDEYVYGRIESDGVQEVQVLYARGNAYYDFDWSYLKTLFRTGTQLNLIRPRKKEGVLYPELVVVEPDYLVDISSISRCFASYAESPLVDLINKLTPMGTSSALVMGNFAGQLLDEVLHDERKAYSDTALDFFRSNALTLLTTPLDPSFHSEARAQYGNIHNAIAVQLPLIVGKYNPRETVVEPSFYSEMLGVQGRMDFLQLDYTVLIEQKSGKAEYVPGNPTPDTPRQREEHYAQILLYMAILRYNYREQYERNKHQLHAFLLYSKYPNSLLGLGFSPELLFRAIKLRNRIAVSNMRFAQEGLGILTTLSPERLNEKNLSGKFWLNYCRKQLDEVLSPIQTATATERMYYLRMLQFVAAEHQLSKLGNQTKENSGFASLWQDSLEEKLAAGSIYDRLTLEEPLEGQGKVEHVVLAFPTDWQNDVSNFRLGDIVLLYPYEQGTVPDARRTIVFRGTLTDITANRLTISLRNAQTDAHVFVRDKDKLWAVEHDFMESSYSSLYRGVQSFLTAPQERRDLLMMQRRPEVDADKTLLGEYGAFDELSLRVKQAKDLFLIIGPPGTGKTSYGMLNTLREELMEEGTSVLLLSYTNRAVDEICSKLHGNIDFIRIGGAHSCAPEYREHLLLSRLSDCNNVAELKHVVVNTRVFVGTTTSVSASLSLFELKQFSLAIIDEASQILEPHLLGILSAQHQGKSAIRKLVMIGDHKQLPAVVQQQSEESAVSEPELLDIGLTNCRLSLFERLLYRYADDNRITYMLTRQGRMHPDIAAFPNEAFYEGKLQIVPLPHQELPSSCSRVVFVDVPTPKNSPSDKVNLAEADVIAARVLAIYRKEKDAFNPEHTLGIIVPYRNQIATIRSTIDRLGIPELRHITIDTVERYQGSQRSNIIYGFTIQQYYQLRFLTESSFVEHGAIIDRKLNVAMTRAQEYLTLVGNARLLSHNPVFARLIDFVKAHGGYREAEG